MSTVRRYYSTDPGAPAHPSATRGSMAALIRACLVTGYGSGEDAKAPAGWEEPFVEADNYACFRALSGVRQFYQTNDNQTDADVTLMTSFDSMSDAATGTGSRGSAYFGKRPATITSTFWAVIADEKTCYVLLSSQYGMVPHCFGEFFSYLDSDPYKGILSGHTTSTYMVSNCSAGMMASLLNYGAFIFRSSTGALIAPDRVRLAAIPSGYEVTYCVNGTNYTLAPLEGRNYPVYPGHLAHNQVVHGKFRGIYYPAAYRPRTDQESFTFDGKTMQAFNMGGSSLTTTYLGQIWIDITGSWEEST